MRIKLFGQHINEAVEQYDFGFTTIVESKKVELHAPVDDSKDQYVNSGDLSIEWEMDFDNRKFGINSIAPIIKKITGTYVVVTPTDDDDIEEEKEFLFDKENMKDWKVECEFNSEFKFGHPMIPDSIFVDAIHKEMSIGF